MLTPSVQAFYAGVEAFRGLGVLLDKSYTFSVGGIAQVARTQWSVNLVDASPAVTDPATGTVTPARNAVTADANATTWALSLGGEYKYIASQGENYVEVRFFLGPGFRGVSLGKDADRTLDKARSGSTSLPSGSFLMNTIGTDSSMFFSIDAILTLRINSLVLSASVPYVRGDVAGLSGMNFIPSITLRAGARLIDL